MSSDDNSKPLDENFLEKVRAQSKIYFETNFQEEIKKAKMELKENFVLEINKKMIETEKQMNFFWSNLTESVLPKQVNSTFDKISFKLKSANTQFFDNQLKKVFSDNLQTGDFADFSQNEIHLNLIDQTENKLEMGEFQPSSVFSPPPVDYGNANSNDCSFSTQNWNSEQPPQQTYQTAQTKHSAHQYTVGDLLQPEVIDPNELLNWPVFPSQELSTPSSSSLAPQYFPGNDDNFLSISTQQDFVAPPLD